MNLENIMLGDISQSQTDKVGFYPYEVSKVVMFIETPIAWWLPGAGGRRKGENCCFYRVPVL